MKKCIILKVCVVIMCLILAILSGCNGETSKNNLPIESEKVSEHDFNVPPSYTVPENYTAPEYNGNMVAGDTVDPKLGNTNFNESTNYWHAHIVPSEALKTKIEEYAGQEVWFRVIVRCWGVRHQYGDLDSVLSYIKNIGGYDLKASKTSEGIDYDIDYEVLLTADMISLLDNLKVCEQMLAQYPRNSEYSEIISDSLSIKLDKMNDTDDVEVVAVCRADKLNTYATKQKATYNTEYNRELYIPYKDGIGMDKNDFNFSVETYITNIAVRNGILQKQVESDVKTGINGSGKVEYNALEEVSAGFNAILTKDEILSLAEDEEIKVIYLARKSS